MKYILTLTLLFMSPLIMGIIETTELDENTKRVMNAYHDGIEAFGKKVTESFETLHEVAYKSPKRGKKEYISILDEINAVWQEHYKNLVVNVINHPRMSHKEADQIINSYTFHRERFAQIFGGLIEPADQLINECFRPMKAQVKDPSFSVHENVFQRARLLQIDFERFKSKNIFMFKPHKWSILFFMTGDFDIRTNGHSMPVFEPYARLLQEYACQSHGYEATASILMHPQPHAEVLKVETRNQNPTIRDLVSLPRQKISLDELFTPEDIAQKPSEIRRSVYGEETVEQRSQSKNLQSTNTPEMTMGQERIAETSLAVAKGVFKKLENLALSCFEERLKMLLGEEHDIEEADINAMIDAQLEDVRQDLRTAYKNLEVIVHDDHFPGIIKMKRIVLDLLIKFEPVFHDKFGISNASSVITQEDLNRITIKRSPDIVDFLESFKASEIQNACELPAAEQITPPPFRFSDA